MNHPQPQQPPWQPREKLELLTEVVRQSRIPPEAVIQFINNHRITPDWGNMLLPQRRSLNQCTAIYEEMMRTSATTGLMRSASVREFGGPQAGVKRPFIPDMAAYGGRMIQPRPEGASLASPSEPSEPPKKKRGRPTKAEAEERRAQAIARGDPYPTPRRSSTMGPMSAGPTSALIARPPSARPPSARPISTRPPSVAPSIAAAQAALGMAPRAPTAAPTPNPMPAIGPVQASSGPPRTPPRAQPQPSSSDSSSGKKRRARAMKPEEDVPRPAAEPFGSTRGGPGPSRYPDILSRDDPPEPQPHRPKTASSQPGGP